MSHDRRVVLGVTGSIAAYKAAELVRLLKKAGCEVQVILTRSGAEFITPLTLATLSGNPVTTAMFGPGAGADLRFGSASDEVGQSGISEPVTPEAATAAAAAPEAAATGSAVTGSAASGPGIRHIQASRESQLIVVAPATGNILGKVAHGIADDPLSTAILASSVPVLFAPAMNTLMWRNAAVQENVALLRRRGYHFVAPGEGELACGEFGAGRMAEPEEIVGEILRLLAPTNGRRLLVTTGRTEEPLDPVRVLSNRSSGRMGFALAEAARDLGYGVTVIAGEVSVGPPAGVEVVRVRTAGEMLREVRRREKAHEILVMAAAVADYRPRQAAPGKIPSGRRDLALALEPTTDILSSLRGRRAGKVTIGFALETERDAARARAKLEHKGCDLLVVNNPLRPGSEFGGETNEVLFLYPDGTEAPFPRASKLEVGREILRRAEEIRQRMEEPRRRAEKKRPRAEGIRTRARKKPARRPVRG